MNTMTYKGYLGSVAYSEKDNVFWPKGDCPWRADAAA